VLRFSKNICKQELEVGENHGTGQGCGRAAGDDLSLRLLLVGSPGHGELKKLLFASRLPP